MIKDTDIAWLAGIIDGEGCFSVKKPVKKGSKGRPCHQVWIVLCNTSQAMVERSASIVKALGCERPTIKKVWKGQKATRWQYWMHIARKDDLLKVTEALLPYLTAKRVEAEAVAWFYRKACSVPYYTRTELDKVVLNALSKVKRNGGEAPADVVELLREVIPSQAFLGADEFIVGSRDEGVETRELSASNNAPHECPAADHVH